jgi:hypothetical protein
MGSGSLEGQYHERLRSTEQRKRSSDRTFGLVIGGVFLILAMDRWLRSGGSAIYWAVAAAVIILLAFARPQVLAPANLIWAQFGMLLHRIVSPVVISLLFFVVITPIGLLMRVCGQTPLALGFDKSARSYWRRRTPPGPEPGSLKRQF